MKEIFTYQSGATDGNTKQGMLQHNISTVQQYPTVLDTSKRHGYLTVTT
jgi:hypothetical protein